MFSWIEDEHSSLKLLGTLESIENGPRFVEHVISSDGSWVFEYDLEFNRQSMEWHTSPIESKITCMLICSFISQRIIHIEFVPEGQTVNKHIYR